MSLAVGFAQIFSSVPGLGGLMAYWYHFAIMFEALFILTTIDTGTRIGRFLIQEFLGAVYKPFDRADWLPGSAFATAVIVFSWAWLIHTGNISTVWPMFGVANQLLAGIALSVATTALINAGKLRHAWVTGLPFLFVIVTTLDGGFLNIRDNYLPLTRAPGTAAVGWVNVVLTVLIMACAVAIVFEAARRCSRVLTGKAPVPAPSGGRFALDPTLPPGCC